MFVYQPKSDTLQLKTRTLIMLSVGNQKGYIILKLHHYVLRSWITQDFMDIKEEYSSIRAL